MQENKNEKSNGSMLSYLKENGCLEVEGKLRRDIASAPNRFLLFFFRLLHICFDKSMSVTGGKWEV